MQALPNHYFDDSAVLLSERSSHPRFNHRDTTCPCSGADIISTTYELLISCALSDCQQLLQAESQGRTMKCAVQFGRELWEPLPFALRYAGIISMLVGSISTVLFLAQFRAKAMRLLALVEEHFDPLTGWPKDPHVLQEEDVRLITGGKTTWVLDYAYLNKLPSFLGLYCGNVMMAFLIHWFIWFTILYFLTCPAVPSDPLSGFLWLSPVIIESLVKKMVWRHIVSPRQGILHPRLYAGADVLLSLTSAYTGPIKTIFRVFAANICMTMHLFRTDVTLMLDSSFLPLDPHFTSTTGLLSALRVQYEFSKIRRERLLDARSQIVPQPVTHNDNSETIGPAQAGAVALTTAVTVESMDISGFLSD